LLPFCVSMPLHKSMVFHVEFFHGLALLLDLPFWSVESGFFSSNWESQGLSTVLLQRERLPCLICRTNAGSLNVRLNELPNWFLAFRLGEPPRVFVLGNESGPAWAIKLSVTILTWCGCSPLSSNISERNVERPILQVVDFQG
jgi:hypothetical protein